MAAHTTTLEVPVALRDRLTQAKSHPRQAYHEVIALALDALADRLAPSAPASLDLLVARHRVAARAAVKRNKGRRAWLFGSRARGDATPNSDVDLLVEFQPKASLLDQAALQEELHQLFGVPVDTVSLGGARGAFRERVLRERVPL